MSTNGYGPDYEAGWEAQCDGLPEDDTQCAPWRMGWADAQSFYDELYNAKLEITSNAEEGLR